MAERRVIVVGAGAAGLTAAGQAAELGARTLLLEKMDSPGRKLRITGRGRCNLTDVASLEEFIKNPKTAPLTKSPNLRLVHWDVTTRKQILTEESKPYIERATELFNLVMANHPGTPWAGRAQRELNRGFGVDFRPDYDPPYLKPSGKLIPIPKL